MKDSRLRVIKLFFRNKRFVSDWSKLNFLFDDVYVYVDLCPVSSLVCTEKESRSETAASTLYISHIQGTDPYIF